MSATMPQPGESFEGYCARMQGAHHTGSPEEYREAARRYVMDFAMWFDGFMAGEPEQAPMPAYRLPEASKARIRALFYPLLQELRAVPVEENPKALDGTSSAASVVIRSALARR